MSPSQYIGLAMIGVPIAIFFIVLFRDAFYRGYEEARMILIILGMLVYVITALYLVAPIP